MSERIDWERERERVDLAEVATNLLGPAQPRYGERNGRRLWWHCPFHDDPNPSFCVVPGKRNWLCFGCGAKGDSVKLVMELEHLTFLQAIHRLTGQGVDPLPGHPKSSRSRRMPERPAEPTGLPAMEALALVERAEAALWSLEGTATLAELTGPRGLTEPTIRAARLGWTPGVELPTRGDRTFTARGSVIPRFNGTRLALVKVRQPSDARPKYAEAMRDRPGPFIAGGVVAAGLDLVVVEGEFDALLMGQELAGMATVATLGGASERVEPATRSRFLSCPRWYIATDADEAGGRAAERWSSGRSRRVRPPGAFKDWTEASQEGVDLRRWWAERLAGVESPALFTWEELSRWRWGPAIDLANRSQECPAIFKSRRPSSGDLKDRIGTSPNPSRT